MKVVIVGSSALIRLYVPDGPIPDGLEKHIASAWRAKATLMVPELALTQVLRYWIPLPFIPL